jgi:low affinity Fe/Cu permease
MADTHAETGPAHPKDVFRRFAAAVAHAVGSAVAFLVALALIIVWAVTGPLFHFSDTWQLVINTGTTIVTFLMVFLIQNTQNRDARAIHLKLDELIRASRGARNQLIDLEELADEDLERLHGEFQRLGSQGVASGRDAADVVLHEVRERKRRRGHEADTAAS